MKNKTKSKITIEMEHLDHASALFNALSRIKNEASKGGDLEISTKDVSCVFVGHDVNIKKIRHTKEISTGSVTGSKPIDTLVSLLTNEIKSLKKLLPALENYKEYHKSLDVIEKFYFILQYYKKDI